MKMNCFWICGVSKKDVLENPICEDIVLVTDEKTIIYPSSPMTPQEFETPIQEFGTPTPEFETPTPEFETPTPEFGTPTPEHDSTKDLLHECKWFGTISTEYNNEHEYYTLGNDDIVYFGRFPLEWALNHEPGSGPNECALCFKNGMHNNVFIGYCVTCATEKYKGLCGRGFISPKVERDDENNTSVYNTYLKDVDLDLVGKEYIWYGFNVEMEYCDGYDENELDELLNC